MAQATLQSDDISVTRSTASKHRMEHTLTSQTKYLLANLIKSWTILTLRMTLGSMQISATTQNNSILDSCHSTHIQHTASVLMYSI